jgi:class 3 adenylate cyclase
LVCARCGQENPDIARFCFACASPLASADSPAEERRVVSILFVDLVGFTSRAEQLDPEDVRAILTPYYQHVREEIEVHGGTVEKFIGDAVMGVFGAPTAYGDDAERAVRAALAVRDWAADNTLQVRLAVNTGEAIVALGAQPAQGEAMVAGDVVNTASRLQSDAPVGSIIVGQETYRSSRTAIEYRPAQPVVAKGKAAPLLAWLALEAHAEAGQRVLSEVAMVGRERELSQLSNIWSRVVEEGTPHLVTVFGPAGVGKSRLALEFSELVAEQGARVLRGRSTPYGSSSPYGPFSHHVKQIARIFDSDSRFEARAKLEVGVATALGSDAGADEHASHLATLLGLDEQGTVRDRETLFFSARVLLEAVAGQEPVVLLFEDIHWADASVLDLIETLAARARDVPLLFLALARPEILQERPTWGGGLQAYTALHLEPLAEGAAHELAQKLLGQSHVDAERVAAVVKTAEGNPLFIEELAASVAERPTSESEELPTSVRAIIAARLDALPPDERSVLLDAAVVGRVFWRGALARIQARDNVGQVLGSLEQRDLVRREAVSRIEGDQQFVFKHVMIRDVAYQILPRAARRERHAAVAEFLEDATSASGQSFEALARHWSAAGHTELAIARYVAAGDQAGRGWAKERAVWLYRQALELIPDGEDERRREVRARLAVALQAVYHFRDVERPAERLS